MYLKKLEIQGFKSFADKLVLDFGAGITTVVGPNGSGKSNISDAVRWVLGEQRAKILRGSKMEDIIFVGTQSRRPVGFAEVSLVIDNSEGILPIDFEEVKITRRLYRSGESEYMINMATCRLKDVERLFFDTGIGVAGYSIIGQGQVDSILSGKVDERRAIFEEASGIMKYKVRKSEAERKLVLTTQNIERIRDIINELRNQEGPLEEQSQIAKKYLALRDELKDYEISSYVESISRFIKQKDELQEKGALISNDIEEKTTSLENIKDDNENINIQYKKVEEQLEEIRNKYYENERMLSDKKTDIRVFEEKIKDIEEDNVKLSLQMKEEQKSIFQIEKEKEDLIYEMEKLNSEKVEENKKLQELEEKNQAIMSLMSERAKNVENLRIQLDMKNIEYSDLSMRNSALNQKKTDSIRRLDEIENEKTLLKNEVEEIESIRKTGEEAEEEFLGKSKGLKEEKNKIVAQREASENKLNELKDKVLKFSSEYQFKTSRLALLNEMDERMEGYNKSVKAIISPLNKETFMEGIKGTIASLIETEKEYEVAIETALGQAFQYIVCDNAVTAKSAIEYLRENKLGRATFLPMTAVNGKALESEVVSKLKTMTGYLGMGHEIVQYDRDYHSVMLSQLGKVAVVEDLDSAVKIAEKFKYSFKIITKKGDIIRPSGAMTGGSIDKGVSTGVIGRKREVEELKERTAELSKIVKRINEETTELTIKNNNVTDKIGKIDTELRDIEIKLVELNSVKQRLKERIGLIADKENGLNNDEKNVGSEKEKTEIEINEISKAIDSLTDEMIAVKDEIDKSETDNSAGRAAIDAMNSQLTEKKVQFNSIFHKIEAVKENYNRTEQIMQQHKNSVKTMQGEIENNNRIIEDIGKRSKQIQETIGAFVKSQESETGRIEKLSLEKQTLSNELLGMADKITNISKNVYLLQEEYNRIEVRIAKLTADEENFRNKLWEDYEITYVNATEYIKGKESANTVTQKYINDLRMQIRELGDVNVNAIEEYKNTKERLTFLTNQTNDLEESKLKLEKIIHDMAIIMKKQFLEHFELINQSFNRVFRELFDGGRAGVVITDESNILESPIEIEVQPPGKKLQNMMLLSGGEKALTAIALLFAILKLKPTPFCILDEIEAALDDTNVIRFAEYITGFSEKTQFVLITHRKGTMEAADAIYGVTMEERGVSKIVSMKFDRTSNIHNSK